MKANIKFAPDVIPVKMTKKEEKRVLDDYDALRELIFREVAPDITAQTTANIIWTLWKMESYGEKRIKRLMML